MRRLACRPGCWVVWGGWHAAPAWCWVVCGGLAFRPDILRLRLRFTHTTQPTGSNYRIHRVGWVLGILAMCEGFGSFPKTQRFVYRSGWVVCGGLACRPGCWVVCGGLAFRPDILRLRLRFTHTTQPTGSNYRIHRVGWVLGILAMCEGFGSFPKTQRFVYGSGWVVCGGWHSAPAWCWVVCGGLAFRPDILRLMLRFTHTTQPTGSNCSA